MEFWFVVAINWHSAYKNTNTQMYPHISLQSVVIIKVDMKLCTLTLFYCFIQTLWGWDGKKK